MTQFRTFTDAERAALKLHGLSTEGPSQLSDAFVLGMRHAAVTEAPAPLNGIAANWYHGEGAIARCSYCGRYSLDPKTLSDRQPVCDCGNKHGWSGSFKKPGPDAKWSGRAPGVEVHRADD